MFYDFTNLTIYTDAENYGVFNADFHSGCTIVCNCTLSEKDTYVVSINTNNVYLSYDNSWALPYREGYWLAGWKTENHIYAQEYYWDDYEQAYNYYEYGMCDAPLNTSETATAIWQLI
jgi:hypothetical protein